MALKKIFLFIISFSNMALAVDSFTTGSTDTGWQSVARNDVMITSSVWNGYSNNCYRSDSAASGKNFFIPTRTAAEWNAVIANKPHGELGLTACVCSPGTTYPESTAIANGSGSRTRTCSSNGASWNDPAWAYACNAGYSWDGSSCVALPPAYTYVWRSWYWGGSFALYFTSSTTGLTGDWWELEDICHRVEDNVAVADSYCNLATKSAARCHWVFQPDQTVWIDECH